MKLFVFTILFYFLRASEAKDYSNITRIGWAGTLVMFRVPKEKVTEKLNEYNSKFSCDGSTLRLPNYQILPEILEPEEHVVVVGIGPITASSFADTLPCGTAEKYSLESPSVAIFIPFLTGPDPNGLPQFKLLIGGYVSTDKPFINPNVAVPLEQVDEIVITDHGVTMKDGDDYFTASWKEKEECVPANYVVATNIGEFVVELIPPFNGKMDFSVCEANDVQEVDMCQAHEQMKDILASSGSNACEYWTYLERFTKCELESYTLDSISEKFRKATLLFEEHTSPIIYEIQPEAQFGSHMKIPCI